VEITGKLTVQQDLEILEQDQCIMDRLERTGETFFFVQPEVPGQQGLHAEYRPVSQQTANRAAADIIRASSSLVIVIKALRR